VGLHCFTVSILSLFLCDNYALITEKTLSVGALDPGSARQKEIRLLMLKAFLHQFSVTFWSFSSSHTSNLLSQYFYTHENSSSKSSSFSDTPVTTVFMKT
jgi:hypothetical protein